FARDLSPHVQRSRGVLPLCKEQSRPWIGCVVHFSLLLPVNEIGKRLLHPLKHVSRFILRPMESMLDLPFDGAEGAVFLVAIAIVLHVLHGCTGKRPFRSPDGASSRADVNRADRA